MKSYTIGVFSTRKDAERAANLLRKELKIPDKEISFMYRKKGDEAGLTRALAKMGVGREKTQKYGESMTEGNVMVVIHTENGESARDIMMKSKAIDVDTFTVNI